MKLVYCPTCQDLVRLYREDRQCKCGQSGGHYEANGRDAVLWGKAIPFGLDNWELGRALQRRPESSLGQAITFFIIPKISPRISYQEQDASWYWDQYQKSGRFEDMTRWLKHRAWENLFTPVRVSRYDPVLDAPGDGPNPCRKPASRIVIGGGGDWR